MKRKHYDTEHHIIITVAIRLAKEAGLLGVALTLFGAVSGAAVSFYEREAINVASKGDTVTVDYITVLLYQEYFAFGFVLTVLFCAICGFLLTFLVKDALYPSF